MYTKDRVQGSSVILDDMFLCVFGGIQPAILTKVMAGGDKDGMTARFSLMVYPDVLEDFEYIDRRPDREATQKVEAVMRKLREMDVEDFFGPADPLNPDRERVFRFSQSAQKTFETWYTNINQQIRTEDLDDALKAHMNKYPGLFARLALIHHLIRRAEGSARSPTEVSNTTAQAVASFIDSYLSPHAQRIYRLLGQHPAHGGARRIAQWLKSELPFEAFSSRDIKQKNWSGLHDDKHVIVALDCLETKGWIKGQEIPPGPLGGRRTIRFLINQKIWGV